MEQVFGTVRRTGRLLLDVRVVYAVVGIVVSIFAHELVHVVLHFGSINAIHFFPDFTTIMALDVPYTPDYNVAAEELLAYGVTFVIQFITIIDIIAIHDSKTSKTPSQILFGPSDTLSKRELDILLQVVSR